ncbi:unnamed protein product [Mytilus edulis]|uniref:DUF4105 domain-containing protein n=2 Tax=Mytilus TaxID=6548 RepID=A0A8S3UUA8_MYTED
MGNSESTPEIVIYVWVPRDGNIIGHASMTLSDDTHISWWPNNKDEDEIKDFRENVSAETVYNYEVDKIWENRDADHIIRIPVKYLNEDAIKRWWNDFKSNRQYHLLTNNCCNAVYDALNAGGATDIAGGPLPNIPHPNAVRRYAETLREAVQQRNH